MEKLVIVPTYNESENIESLLDQILAQPHRLEVLVVDDGSPDGTGDRVAARAANEPRIHLLERGAQFIFEMDADFSHDPDSIGDLIAAADDVDVVLGSRYLDGRVTVVNWPLSRLFLSFFANLYTRWITGLPVHDATGGFKCFRRRALEAIRLDRVRSDGYAFQIEMSFKCWKKGFRIREVPIVFVDRRHGVSKMNRRIIWEAAGMVWRLRLASLLGRLE